jgi:hypothetical protein
MSTAFISDCNTFATPKQGFLKVEKETFLGYAFVCGTNPKHEEGQDGV